MTAGGRETGTWGSYHLQPLVAVVVVVVVAAAVVAVAVVAAAAAAAAAVVAVGVERMGCWAVKKTACPDCPGQGGSEAEAAPSCRARTSAAAGEEGGRRLCDVPSCSLPAAAAVVVKRNDHLVSVLPETSPGRAEDERHLLTVFLVAACFVPSACCQRQLPCRGRLGPSPACLDLRAACLDCLEEAWRPCLAFLLVQRTWRGGRAGGCSGSCPAGWRLARGRQAGLAAVSWSLGACWSTGGRGRARACRGRSQAGSRPGKWAEAACSYWGTAAAASCAGTRGSPACRAGLGTAVECSAVRRGTDRRGSRPCSCLPSGRTGSRTWRPPGPPSSGPGVRTCLQGPARPSWHRQPSSAAAARTFHQDILVAGRGNLRHLLPLPPPVLPSCRSPPVSLLQAGSLVAHRDLRSPEDSRGRGPGLVLDLQAGN